MTKITEKEKAVIINIAENEYTELNGAVPEEYGQATCWDDCIEYGPRDIECPSGKNLSGVCASLTKKELMYSVDSGTSDGYVGLTEKGFEVYKTFDRK